MLAVVLSLFSAFNPVIVGLLVAGGAYLLARGAARPRPRAKRAERTSGGVSGRAGRHA